MENEICVDIDECAGDIGGDDPPCAENADCINNEGSFTCKCADGFSGDGVTCVNSNECVSGNHNCHVEANCIDRVGSFICQCRSGYEGQGSTNICVLIQLNFASMLSSLYFCC